MEFAAQVLKKMHSELMNSSSFIRIITYTAWVWIPKLLKSLAPQTRITELTLYYYNKTITGIMHYTIMVAVLHTASQELF